MIQLPLVELGKITGRADSLGKGCLNITFETWFAMYTEILREV